MVTSDSIPMTVQIHDEEKPFVWSVTDRGSGSVLVDVGDQFEPNNAWGSGEAAALQQIGMGMVLRGLQFLGLDQDERRAVAALALRFGGGITTDLDDEDDEL